MAQTRGGNLQRFVQKQNPQLQVQPPANAAAVNKSASMDDLKMPTGANGRRVPASDNKATKIINRPASRAGAAQSHQQPFYGTDADSIDRTSTGSTKRANSTKRQQQQPVTQAPAEQHVHEEPRLPGEVSSDDDLPVDPMRHQQQTQHHSTNDQDNSTAPHEYAHGIVQQHIKGDSYPPTTEGELSLPDQQAELPPYSTHPPAGALPTRGGVGVGLPNRGTGTRVPAQSCDVATQQAQQNQPAVAQTNQLPFQPHLRVGDTLNDINQNFIFGAGPLRQPATAVAPHQKTPIQQQSVATNAAQSGSAPALGQLQQTAERHHLPQDLRYNGMAEARQHHRQADFHPHRVSGHHDQAQYAQQRPVQDNPAPSNRHQQMISRTMESQNSPINHGRNFQQRRQSSYEADDVEAEGDDEDDDGEEEDEEEKEAVKEPAPEPEPQFPPDLDYLPDDVVKMDYAALRNQPFDVDPNDKGFKFPDDQQQDTLQQKLNAASELPVKAQGAFFASLTIDQWEDAGDWFLDRFSEVSKKFKAARQDKRKASRAFEAQIEQRHEAVSKKRKLTEDALSEMKKSGAVVLQKGTPKKSKRTK